MNILNKLTVKHLKMNKKRTIVTIVGVILSTALMVGIGLLFSTLRDNSLESTKLYSGDYHAAFTSVNADKLKILEKNTQIESYFISHKLGYSKIDELENNFKPYIKVMEVNDDYFNELTLVKGRLPKNKQEIVISKHLISDNGLKYQIGDELNLNVGTRYLADGKLELYYTEGEELVDTQEQKYKIVGVVERDVYESYSDPGYSVFTLNNNFSSDNLNVHVKYKNVSKTYDLSFKIAKNLGLEVTMEDGNKTCRDIQYNDALLTFYGVSRYDNMMRGMGAVLAIILTLISIGCIIVIYNSFAISVMERKKQFGLFSSIGATKKQLQHTVFYEAFIVGIIGIPIGIISGIVGIGTVLLIINKLLPASVFPVALRLSVYPLFIIIPILFMIVVIIASAFIPAHRASKITPIEAIRLNDDIKIKNKKLKTPRFIRKLFGVEGEIALKNIKRNKKKYRITIASLFISIVLFVSFSSFLFYAFEGADNYLGTIDYDLSISDIQDDDIIETIRKHEQVEKSAIISHAVPYTTLNYKNYYTDNYKKLQNNDDTLLNVIIAVLDDKSFANYLKEIGAKKSKPVIFNRYKTIQYSDSSRKAYDVKRFADNVKFEIPICSVSNMAEMDESYDYTNDKYNVKPEYDCYSKITDYYVSDVVGFPLEAYSMTDDMVIIMSNTMAKSFKLNDSIYNTTLYIKSSKYDKLDDQINNYIDEGKIQDYAYTNVTESMRLENNLILVVKILVYGFISLVTLIGVTSVFNTINTSIALRRKEFAMLRSIGLTPRGFNRILYFESIFVGLKSLLYALPVSFGVVILLHMAMGNFMEFEKVMIPYKSVLIAVIGVFVIIGITMAYASKKIKKENILEAIREENI